MGRIFDTIRIICGLLVLAGGLMGLGLFGWEPPVAGPEARPFQIAMHDAGYFLPIMTGCFSLRELVSSSIATRHYWRSLCFRFHSIFSSFI